MQLGHSAWQVPVAESLYLLFYEEAETLKQRLDTDVFCDVEMEQSLISASNGVLGYMDVQHLKAVNSQNTLRESFRGPFELLAQRQKTQFRLEVVAVSKSVN